MKLLLILGLYLMGSLSAQVNVLNIELKLNRKDYISHEHILAEIAVTNNSAQEITLQNKNGLEWLEFKIAYNYEIGIRKAKRMSFQAVSIPPGKTIKREVALTLMYPMTKAGNYSVRAQLNPNIANWGTIRSNPVYCSVNNGTSIFRRQIGVKADGGKITEYRVKFLNRIGGNKLYFQSYDVAKKKVTNTYSLGKYISINRPQFSFDGNGYLNTLFQVDAKLYRYLKIKNDGTVLKDTFHKIGSSGVPKLVKKPKTEEVVVWNATLYDAQEEAEKRRAVHNISQRPPFSY